MQPPADIQPNDYPSILQLWTREDQGFAGFEHKITAKATMIAPMLRVAFQRRFPEVYGYGGQVTRTELREAAQADTVSFFIAMYAPNYRWMDLEKPDSIWHVTLQRAKDEDAKPEATIDAIRIEKVKKDENLNTIFPYLNPFDQVYIARFPSTAISRGEKAFIRLRITSSFAESTMGWQLEP